MTLPLGRLAALGVGIAMLTGASPAVADTVSEYYSGPGSYTAFVPQYATSLNVIANGAAGTDGATTGGNDAHGGAGGLGAEVNATLAIGPGTPFSPGDILQVSVGTRGGGARGGSGNEIGVAGGNGGGAAVVTDLSAGNRVIVAAGGGGGGGGAGGVLGYNGGAGGEGPGDRANGASGAGLGAGGGGNRGDDGGCATLSVGAPGGSAGGGTDAGGGGGGGDGVCGAPGGSAGGAGAGGGGGGGAGASLISRYGNGTIGLTAFAGNANVALHYTRSDTAPQITSPASATVAAGGGAVTAAASGFPAPRFQLADAPSWLSIDPATGTLSYPAQHRRALHVHDRGVQRRRRRRTPAVHARRDRAEAGAAGAARDRRHRRDAAVVRADRRGRRGALQLVGRVGLAAGGAHPRRRRADRRHADRGRKLHVHGARDRRRNPGGDDGDGERDDRGRAEAHRPAGGAGGGLRGQRRQQRRPLVRARRHRQRVAADVARRPRDVAERHGGITIAQDGRTYVSSANNQEIAEYAYGASGNVMPASVIAGGATGLASPQGLALDGGGRLYVANAAANTITAYAPGATGNAKPVSVIAGPHTGLANPAALTFDRLGHLWVANFAGNSLTEYAAGASGDAAPLATIAGFATRLNGPQGLALDSGGNLLVADTYDNSITEYLPTANGNTLPIRRIAGASTGLSFPVGIDVDAQGNVYVSNQFGGVEAFSFPANGNRTPLTSIAGPSTGLAAPGRLAVAPPLSVRTAKLPAARVGRRYRAVLRASLGTTPYRWTLRGRLPQGLRLRGGQLAGRPRRAGTFRLTVIATDASRPAMRATRRLALVVGS